MTSLLAPASPQLIRASNEEFTVTEKGPSRAFSWLKVPTSTFTFKTLLIHYAKQALTHSSFAYLRIAFV